MGGNESDTYNEVNVAMSVDLVGDVEGAAPVLCGGDLGLLLGLEVPDGVGILWVLDELFSQHGSSGHDDGSTLGSLSGVGQERGWDERKEDVEVGMESGCKCKGGGLSLPMDG